MYVHIVEYCTHTQIDVLTHILYVYRTYNTDPHNVYDQYDVYIKVRIHNNVMFLIK